MADDVDTIVWPWNLLAYKRSYVTDFDIGTIAMPFQCHLSPMPKRGKRWLYGIGGLLGCLFGCLIVWASVKLMFKPVFEFWETLLLLGVGLAFAVGGGFFLLHPIFGGRKQLTLRIDADWVEVDDRPPLGRRLHWREPLSNYSGVRCHAFKVQTSTRLSEVPPSDYNVHAIDLDHPEPDRVVPLLRTTDKGEVERRWQAFAEALGKPMTGSHGSSGSAGSREEA